jgi:hypothetical protein
MFTLSVTTNVLAVLYGLAWHNRPAKTAPEGRDELS